MAVYDLGASTSESDDDGDVDSSRENEAAEKHVREAAGITSPKLPTSGEAFGLSVYGDAEPPRKRRKQTVTEPERLEWSEDDSTNAGEAAYREFKGRDAEAKRKAIKTNKKARAVEAESKPVPKSHGGTGVGRQKAPRRGRRAKSKTREDLLQGEDPMESTVPDYLKERRTRFDERTERLKQGGLHLPPSFDDVDFSDDEQLEYLKERPVFPHAKPCAPYEDIPLPYSLGLIPAPVAQWLRDYQVKGTAFLHELFVYQKGGLLGDDMGLGKTVQVIAFLTAAYGKTGDERDQKRMRKMRRSAERSGRWYPRTLIICPGSLMSNWQDEFIRWGWWHVDLYHGPSATRDAVLSAAQSGWLEVMITTYTTYRMNKAAINMISWDCVIADECHQFKEQKSELAKSVNEVNALCRIGLTGTAIQNKYEELWTLLNWTNPGLFGPISTWKSSICEPLKLGQSHDATVYQLSRARKTAKKLVENLLPQFFLRRMKSLIKDQLPKKSDRVVFCPLTPTQARAYENFLDSEAVQAIKYSGEPCTCGSGKKAGWCCHMFLADGSKWQSWVFPAITTLQKLSNHLAALIPQGADPAEKQAKDLEMLKVAIPDRWKELYNSRDNIINFANPDFCGKWRILKKILKFWHDEDGVNNKVLVFSHSVRLLKMLQMLFVSTSYNVSYLDGSMSYEDRYTAVADFNTDPSQFVFLISTRAGGVGLNITSANKVVVFDPNWNPSYDLQAQDRAYRIGQTRDVEVFRLVSQGTLEEIVYARQIYKQQQASIGYNASTERRYFKGVQDRKDQKGEIFGLDNLFAYQNDNILLRDIVNKTNVAESKADIKVAKLDLEEEDESGTEDGDTLKDEKRDDDDLQMNFKTEADSEDAAISQLAAMIIGENEGPKSIKRAKRAFSSEKAHGVKKHDPIQAILSSVGVKYTHENSEVVGSSRVEARLSKRAEQVTENEGVEPRDQDAKVFSEENQGQSQAGLHPLSGPPSNRDNNGRLPFKYRPPEDVKRRQFCSMAKWAGFDDPVEFALVVEGWTQAERRDWLSRFYRWRRDALKRGDLEAKKKGEDEEDDHDSGKEVKKEEEEEEDDDDEEMSKIIKTEIKSEDEDDDEEMSKIIKTEIKSEDDDDDEEMSKIIKTEIKSEDEDDEDDEL